MINECLDGAFVFEYKEHEGNGEKDTLTINFNDELKWVFITKNIKDFDGLRAFIEEGEYIFHIDDDLRELKNKGLLKEEYLKNFGLNLKEFEALIQRLKENENHCELLFEGIGYFYCDNQYFYSDMEDTGYFIDAKEARPMILDPDSGYLDASLELIFEKAKQGDQIILTTEDFEEVESYLPTLFDIGLNDWTRKLIEDGSLKITGNNEYKSEYAKILISDYAERNGIEFHLEDLIQQKSRKRKQ